MNYTRFTLIESPFKGNDWQETARNLLYTRACVKDCIDKNEVPYASHLFLTQRGILNDRIPEEREKGIRIGKAIENAITLASHYDRSLYVCTAVYTDLGISAGMEFGINMAKAKCRDVVYRELGKGWEERFRKSLDSADWMDLGLF